MSKYRDIEYLFTGHRRTPDSGVSRVHMCMLATFGGIAWFVYRVVSGRQSGKAAHTAGSPHLFPRDVTGLTGVPTSRTPGKETNGNRV